jgi:hypothetical protein
MIPQILEKLTALLNAGITTEAQAVYLLAAIRKIIEQEQANQQYKYLNFHCNWALHSSLDRRDAQEILILFDDIHTHCISGNDEFSLDRNLERELTRISRMESFKKDLSVFLQDKGLPSIDTTRSDGWVHFLHLYAKVIEDCPLVLKNGSRNIERVTVNVDIADQVVGGEVCFRVVWTVGDKNGLSGSHEIYNTFSLEPEKA